MTAPVRRVGDVVRCTFPLEQDDDGERVRTDWQRIATAPKDGTMVLLWWRENLKHFGITVPHLVGAWWHTFSDGSAGWVDVYQRPIRGKPTHWIPVPPLPEL